MGTLPLKDFNTWFTKLRLEAVERGCTYLIAWSHPEQYRDYFDDEDTPEQVIEMELKAARKRLELHRGTYDFD